MIWICHDLNMVNMSIFEYRWISQYEYMNMNNVNTHKYSHSTIHIYVVRDNQNNCRIRCEVLNISEYIWICHKSEYIWICHNIWIWIYPDLNMSIFEYEYLNTDNVLIWICHHIWQMNIWIILICHPIWNMSPYLNIYINIRV